MARETSVAQPTPESAEPLRCDARQHRSHEHRAVANLLAKDLCFGPARRVFERPAGAGDLLPTAGRWAMLSGR